MKNKKIYLFLVRKFIYKKKIMTSVFAFIKIMNNFLFMSLIYITNHFLKQQVKS